MGASSEWVWEKNNETDVWATIHPKTDTEKVIEAYYHSCNSDEGTCGVGLQFNNPGSSRWVNRQWRKVENKIISNSLKKPYSFALDSKENLVLKTAGTSYENQEWTLIESK
jgi:hypothetical protein